MASSSKTAASVIVLRCIIGACESLIAATTETNRMVCYKTQGLKICCSGFQTEFPAVRTNSEFYPSCAARYLWLCSMYRFPVLRLSEAHELHPAETRDACVQVSLVRSQLHGRMAIAKRMSSADKDVLEARFQLKFAAEGWDADQVTSLSSARKVCTRFDRAGRESH